MKLIIVCLVVLFACVLASPLPEDQGKEEAPKAAPKAAPKGQRKGLMQSMFDMFTGIPKKMLSVTDRMVGKIPFMGMFPKMMESGLDVGEGVAKGMDRMMQG